MHLAPGIGFWDISDYPIGGCFDRNGNTPMAVKVMAVFNRELVKLCDATGEIETGKIAFRLEGNSPHKAQKSLSSS